jgi:DNA-binding PadR family transcriptional regulator
MATITELEGVVLGILRSLQPCTAYAVRRQIQASPSTHWSASAGSIYPLLGRLEGAGLVEALSDAVDGRGRRLMTLTRKGNAALRRWILEAGEPDIAANVSDALRTRAFFLDALSAAERRRFVESALQAAEAFHSITEEYGRSRAEEGGIARLAALGGEYAAEARVRWLRELLTSLDAEDE